MSDNLTPWQKYKQSIGDTRPWDIVNPKVQKVDDSIAEQRLEICKTCPEIISLTTQCKKCGCFMAVKTKLESATCPLSKW